MPRNKTFRKRRQKRVQKGGASYKINGINASLQEFNDVSPKYYGMVQKTRRNINSGSLSDPTTYDIDYESFIINQDQKNAICANEQDKVNIMKNNTNGGDDSFKQFYEDPLTNGKNTLITFFEFANGAGENKKLEEIQINTINDINWKKYIGC